jgi:hypothetical protein
MDGFSHCGVAAHTSKVTGSLKFNAQENAFYINGGGNWDRPTARKDPVIHVDNVPPELRDIFKRKMMTSAQWTRLFVDTLNNANNSALGDSIKTRSSTSCSLLLHLSEDDGVVLREEDYKPNYEPEPRLEFEWTGLVEKALIGKPSPSHRAALELLRNSHKSNPERTQAQRQEVQDLRQVVERQGMTLKAYLRKMGQIDGLTQAHGTIAKAIEEALSNGNAARLTNLQDQIGDFQQDLEQCANETTTSKSTLLKLMTRIWAQNVKQLEALGVQMQVLESRLNFGVAHAPVVVPIGIPNAMRVSPQRTSGLNADTVFGVGHIGRVDVDLSMNMLFGLVKSLDAKVQILAEWAKNTGVLFHEIAYASKKECCLAYHPLNPSGKGVAGFVDIISI